MEIEKDNAIKVICGLDLSLNHFAIVAKSDDKLFWMFADTLKKYLKYNEHYWLLPKRRNIDFDNFGLIRQSSILHGLGAFINIITDQLKGFDNKLFKFYLAFEDYSYGSKSSSLIQIAECGGVVRFWASLQGFTMRYYDPLSVKMFMVGTGKANKEDMVRTVSKEGFTCVDDGFLFTIGKKDISGPATDLADAYALMKMLEMEIQLKDGEKDLKDLPEHQRKVFLRATKRRPVNLLGGDFVILSEPIVNGDGLKI